MGGGLALVLGALAVIALIALALVRAGVITPAPRLTSGACESVFGGG